MCIEGMSCFELSDVTKLIYIKIFIGIPYRKFVFMKYACVVTFIVSNSVS